jgi:peptidoglycan/xylan/chitin deacetylase (PgdA/CDA1 family)
MNAGIRTVLRALSPAGSRARLSILIFHRVHPVPDSLYPDEPDARRFTEILNWAGNWFDVLPLPEAVERLCSGSLPDRAAAITFDDGYADNCVVALPILQQHGMHATFFVATAFMNGGRMFNDTVIEAVRRVATPKFDLTAAKLGVFRTGSFAEKRDTVEAVLDKVKYLPQGERDDVVNAIKAAAGVPLPDDLMMSDDQVRRLRDAGMEIGAHTRTHPILARCTPSVAEAEIANGRDDLGALLGRPPRLFAYPNGKPGRDYAPSHVDMVKRLGFEAAVSTSPGAARTGDDVFELPRFTPWARRRLRFGVQLAQNLAANRPARAEDRTR